MKVYTAKKVDSEMSICDARWDRVEPVALDFTWDSFSPIPYKTTSQMVHSDEGITVRLKTNEWPLRVTVMNNNEHICGDSCMEFFFIPNSDSCEYFNFEMNPAAVLLSCLGEERHGRRHISIDGEDVKIDSHIDGQCGWSVMAYIPYSFLLKHYPRVDKRMRANFYKCGDHTVKPHYATWNPVGTQTPDYHRPEFFGEIILSDESV